MSQIEQPTEILELQNNIYEKSHPRKNDIFNSENKKNLFLPTCLVLAFLFVFSVFVISMMNQNNIVINFLQK